MCVRAMYRIGAATAEVYMANFIGIFANLRIELMMFNDSLLSQSIASHYELLAHVEESVI